MSSFQSFGRKAGHAADQMLKLGADLLDSGKTKMAITRERHKIDEAFYKIGAVIFDLYADDEENAPTVIAAEIAEIKERRARIDALINGVEAEGEEDTADIGEEIIVDISEEPATEETKEE